MKSNKSNKGKTRPKGSREKDEGDTSSSKESKGSQKQVSSLLKYDGVAISSNIYTWFKFMKNLVINHQLNNWSNVFDKPEESSIKLPKLVGGEPIKPELNENGKIVSELDLVLYKNQLLKFEK